MKLVGLVLALTASAAVAGGPRTLGGCIPASGVSGGCINASGDQTIGPNLTIAGDAGVNVSLTIGQSLSCGPGGISTDGGVINRGTTSGNQTIDNVNLSDSITARTIYLMELGSLDKYAGWYLYPVGFAGLGGANVASSNVLQTNVPGGWIFYVEQSPSGAAQQGWRWVRDNAYADIPMSLSYATEVLSVDGGLMVGPQGVSTDGGLSLTIGALTLGTTPSVIVAKPSLTSFGGTGATITGTGLSFIINVGTGSPGSSGTLTFATTATNGYNCACYDESASPLTQTKASADTNTTCVLTNYTVATGAAANWSASDKIHCIAAAY